MKKSNLTRKDLARTINERIGFSNREAGELVDHFFTGMKKALIEGENIKLVQFGTFTVRQKDPRAGRNPRTGETMEICRRSMVSFRPSKIVRERVNK